jgi:hypothetical protein
LEYALVKIQILFLLALFAPSDFKIPFQEHADAFLVDLGVDEPELDAVLEQGYVVARLGLFEVWFPRYALRDKKQQKAFKSTSGAVLDMQEKWIEWVADGEVLSAAKKDLRVLRKWIKSWNTSRLTTRRSQETGRPYVAVALQAGGSIPEASARLGELMTTRACLGRDEKRKEPLCLILSPTRKDFVGLGSFLGSLSEENRRILWHDGLALWSHFSRNKIHVLSLEQAVNYPGQGDITQGQDMSAREKNGLAQHVVQHVTDLMLKEYYGQALHGDLAAGLAINMVIEIFRENNVRAGGGTKARKTAAFSRFVPGGSSSGGVLPGKSAESRWRKNKGKDHFHEVLRQSWKAGKKKGYALKSDDGVEGALIVTPPFFVGSSTATPVTAECLDDCLEFLRAYRSAFAYWMQTRASSPVTEGGPSDLLKRLLRSIDGEGSFDRQVQKIYGVPFSVDEEEGEGLEQQFIAWLH